MKESMWKGTAIRHGGVCAALLLALAAVPAHPQGVIIDHTCTDLTQVPDEYITAAQQSCPAHYAHRSHGSQVTVGLGDIYDAGGPAVATGEGYLPEVADALRVFTNLPGNDYPYPLDYFGGVQSLLNDNPSIRVSMFSWCDEMYSYLSSEVDDYLNAMSSLEAANPSVTFVYMTATAQDSGVAAEARNRHARNEQIRSYCRANNRVLFDFADIDCWHDDEQHTEGEIPVEHPAYSGDYEGTHTTRESCINKGSAFWWLMARVAGWQGGVPGPSPTPMPGTPRITLSCDKYFFASSYDTIVIYADALATSNFTPYIRITTPSGGQLFLVSGNRLVGWMEPFIQGPLSLTSDITGYQVASFEFSNAVAGAYRLDAALVGPSGIIGGVDSNTLTVEDR